MNIVGEEFISDQQIKYESKISEDLRLDQFDVMDMRIAIISEFGPQSDIFHYIYQLDIDQMINLSVSNLTDFVAQRASA
ncbi:MAG: hypothetical protein WBA74_04800 [Cyclobacteriaceae bacterium]